MEMKWTEWYAMTSHVIAYGSTELLFGTHTFNFNCFFDDFNCVFTQMRCLSRLLPILTLLRRSGECFRTFRSSSYCSLHQILSILLVENQLLSDDILSPKILTMRTHPNKFGQPLPPSFATKKMTKLIHLKKNWAGVPLYRMIFCSPPPPPPPPTPFPKPT